jgi:hypothetical protein
MSPRMSASRWSRLLSLLAVLGLVLGASVADAQVFKPRGKAGKAPAAAARKTANAVPSKQPTRATGAAPAPRRGVAAAPAKKSRNTGKARDDQDVVIIDDDDDVVTITDDD